MTTEQKQQLFIGTLTLEVILILAIGWALFAPIGHPPEAPPVVEQTPDDPPAITLPQVASSTNPAPGPVLTAAEVKDAIAHSIVGICSNNIGFPPCQCADAGTPTTFDSGTPFYCLIPSALQAGPVMYSFAALSSHHAVSGFSGSKPPGEGCSSCGGGPGPQAGSPELAWSWRTDFRSLSETASLGPGMFANYDLRLHLYADDSGTAVMDLFDPQDLAVRRLRNSWGGGEEGGGDPAGMFTVPESWFVDARYRTIRGVQLEDAAGDPVATPDLAARATLYTHAGTRFEFGGLGYYAQVGGYQSSPPSYFTAAIPGYESFVIGLESRSLTVKNVA